MSNDSVLQLVSIASKLVGTTCWRVVAGGATGSRFNLDFGARLEWPRRVNNPKFDNEFTKYYGEFGLQVGCAAWRLDNESEPVTAWTDLAIPDGPMVMGLRQLQDRVVTKSEITRPGLDLLLEFDKKYILRVFCDQFDQDLDNYTVSYRGTYVAVEARSQARVEVCLQE